MKEKEEISTEEKTWKGFPPQHLDGLIYGWLPNTHMIMPGGDDIRTMPGDNGVVYFWRTNLTSSSESTAYHGKIPA